MNSKLKSPEGVGDKIAAIGTDGADIQAIIMYLYARATTKDCFAAVAELDAATNKQAVLDCVPALKRAFWLGDDHD